MQSAGGGPHAEGTGHHAESSRCVLRQLGQPFGVPSGPGATRRWEPARPWAPERGRACRGGNKRAGIRASTLQAGKWLLHKSDIAHPGLSPCTCTRYLLRVQVTRTTFIPLLVSAHSDRVDPAAVRDEGFAGLSVVYTFGPDFGRRVVTHADLGHLQLHPHALRQAAYQHLEVLSSRAEFHGQPPALMLSFDGLESSLLLANDFWSRLEGAVPGEIVVGVPARDCVIVTGSQSAPGLEKAKRCVERVFFAGGDNLISRGLLVRRGGTWEPFDRKARPSGRPSFGPAHLPGVGQPPRQYQEHPSWPGERIPPQPATHRPGAPGRPAPVRRRPMPGMPPAALDQTGSHRLDQTGSHRLGLEHTGSHRLDRTGSQPPVSAMPGPMPMSRPPEPPRDYTADVAEAAQYSAVPYSAVPYSAVPYSAMPYSAAPYDAAAYAIAPQSVAPNAVASPAVAHSPYPPAAPEPYTTGAIPRVSDYPTSAPVSYPASWGSAPEPPAAPRRPEFRTGPRARFS